MSDSTHQRPAEGPTSGTGPVSGQAERGGQAAPTDPDGHRVSPETGLPVSAPQAAWPEPVDTGPRQISYRIDVQAPADELWALLADPHRHHEADGSGTVKSRVSGPRRLAVGDEFRVHMKKYGVPYVMKLVTTASEPGELIEWQHPAGHRWRWRFEDLGEGRTRVTETFDYSWARPAVARGFELLRITRDNANGIASTLTRLAGQYL